MGQIDSLFSETPEPPPPPSYTVALFPSDSEPIPQDSIDQLNKAMANSDHVTVELHGQDNQDNPAYQQVVVDKDELYRLNEQPLNCLTALQHALSQKKFTPTTATITQGLLSDSPDQYHPSPPPTN